MDLKDLDNYNRIFVEDMEDEYASVYVNGKFSRFIEFGYEVLELLQDVFNKIDMTKKVIILDEDININENVYEATDNLNESDALFKDIQDNGFTPEEEVAIFNKDFEELRKLFKTRIS